ncbi:AAA family ATPase [Paenactinomyces guangxiensis]|uniref:AAA family ATPase n=1 Tax=Paenactinomyces guangxiensis TaxID=1490290 RepID=A0A7W1WSA2_9BACL|nr:AAA family ATPase [Paenactinomyces guangxiensis]MBA4495143.1 AAA family ATPase [Paenactinomyces guangxiensis]MBH8592173.1 AAA family ATPase [Paenactinomyces guangxiensis]
MVKAIAIGTGLGIVVFLIYLGVNPLPLLIFAGIIAALVFVSGTGVNQRGFGANKKRNSRKDSIPTVAFDDIGGQERAKKELMEALDFLIFHDQIVTYGIRPIKGILLSGPPGTGKTLMAKAAAHYTNSVFVSSSGSEFVEMYVGVGAQRIRDLFRDARTLARKKRKTSAIIFIDEIDVIGGKREGSQHREYDQTLNQLLTEMDGIISNQDIRILVIAATNRKDMLDAALLRPGRFDRHITVDLPDKKARLQILNLHTRNKPLCPDVDLEQVASETFGFSGAQLESLTNEAAIYAMREKQEQIQQKHLSLAIDKIMMGEKTDREATQEEKERVAIHELGHAIISELVRPGSVSQVSLAPRGQALGYVRHHPEQDRYLYTRQNLEDQIKVCLAGAAAEQYIYRNKSTGARNDYEQANRYARILIEAGLSQLGIIDPELISKEKMHEETTKIIRQCFERTFQHIRQFHTLFQNCLHILLKEEVLSGDEFRNLLKQYAHETAKIDRVN